MANGKVTVSFKAEDIPMIIETMEELQQENKQLKEVIQNASDTLDSHNEMINNLQKRIDMCCREIDEVLIYNDFKDTTSGIGNIPKNLKRILKG